MITVMDAAKINAVFIVLLMIPRSIPTAAAAMTKLMVDVNKIPELIDSRQENHLRKIKTKSPLDKIKASKMSGNMIKARASCINETRSSLAPTITKNIGIKKPKPNAFN